MEFSIGQRWISHSETQLGLGLVTEAAGRRVKILFPAVGESRIYATDTAPLSRIQYSVGDTVTDSNDNSYVVNEFQETEGLITYFCPDADGNIQEISELDLNCFVRFTTPQQRLFSGQLDKNKNFALRIQTLLHIHHLQQSPVKGLLGSRTDLLPHQIYIAENVSSRHLPRVLLADEVGLGKTIEAGMILHHQIYTGQARRVLILVPDSLIHQWLVEMLRRFNLNFSIFDQERIDTLTSEGYENPFESEQQILCPLSLICQQNESQSLVLNTQWDMVIVDEAHHLVWTEKESSLEYKCVEQLASQCESLLLLTATPEQAGIESHFARLRLIDPDRFHSLSEFKKEQQGYEKLNDLVQILLQEKELTPDQKDLLQSYLGESYSDNNEDNILKLLDQHGTGRVLFRNTRNAVQGFPKRKANPYSLALNSNDLISKSTLYPETEFNDESWLKEDPRVTWLIDKLKELKPNKVLVICHHAKTAVALDNYLNLRMGIRSTSFYEDLSIIERDRAAAYFAEGSNPDELDNSDGAQVLICSEIGSEGRNFQFSHHLILFDLPSNPDLLEQRIGRLDRIGQKQDIQIHIPYLKDTAQEVLFRWMHEGIHLFTQSCSAGYEIYKKFYDRLNAAINMKDTIDGSNLNLLVKDTEKFTEATMESLHAGRDQLLELNSCNKKQANRLIERILVEDRQQELIDYMDLVFDQFGVESEYHSEYSYVLRPGDHMHANFPGLKDEGNTITFNRDKALRREDMEFLSWEHPMISESMEMIQNSEFGNTAVAVISVKGIPKGTLLIETWYAINVIANKILQLDKYLPLHPTRFLLDNNSKDYSKALNHEAINSLCSSVPKKTALTIVKQTRPLLQDLISKSQLLADKELVNIQAEATAKMNQNLNSELDRLSSLQKVNSNIRNEEIEFVKNRIATSSETISRACFQLEAVRILVNN